METESVSIASSNPVSVAVGVIGSLSGAIGTAASAVGVAFGMSNPSNTTLGNVMGVGFSLATTAAIDAVATVGPPAAMAASMTSTVASNLGNALGNSISNAISNAADNAQDNPSHANRDNPLGGMGMP
jgi:hypothetical protein